MNFKNKDINIKRDKLFLAVVAIFISIYTSFSCVFFASACAGVREDVVRLHILANSNSEEDQQIKIKVRDALLKANSDMLSEKVNADNAHIYFEENKEELLSVVLKTLKENGYCYNAQIFLQRESYETREYGNLTFPAGEYLSLKVILGSGEGRNWWCVMFPPLCVPAADDVKADNEKTAEYLSPEGVKIINGGEKYVVKFKLLELYEELMQKIKE